MAKKCSIWQKALERLLMHWTSRKWQLFILATFLRLIDKISEGIWYYCVLAYLGFNVGQKALPEIKKVVEKINHNNGGGKE